MTGDSSQPLLPFALPVRSYPYSRNRPHDPKNRENSRNWNRELFEEKSETSAVVRAEDESVGGVVWGVGS